MTDYFPRIKELVREAAPELGDGAITHAANKITNELRRDRQDCYEIEVSRSPWNAEHDGYRYFLFFMVEASGVVIYVRVTVD